MPVDESSAEKPAPVIYVTDLAFARFDPADLFDLAFLTRSPNHDLVGVCLTEAGGEGERVLSAFGDAARETVAVFRGTEGLVGALGGLAEPVNLVVVGGYAAALAALERDRALFRRNVARVFVVGGYANDYAVGVRPADRRVPTDPRLEQRNPERFTPRGDLRLAETEKQSWAALLTSGEAIIWLPRDVSLWRYAAPQVLAEDGMLSEFLRRELLYANLVFGGMDDRYAAATAPVLLSALPALLLAYRADPMAWMRLFRAVAMRVEADESGAISALKTAGFEPNAYAVVAIDGVALGKLLTSRLRDRPLPGV